MGKTIARGIIAPIGLIDKDLGRAVLQVTAVVAPFIPGGQAIAAVAAIGLATVYKKTPKVPAANLSRLGLSFDPGNATRKTVLGHTAMGTDVLYVEPSGTDQEYADYIIACAAHPVESIESIYIDDKPLWTVGGGIDSAFSGYAWVTAITEGTSGNAVSINGGTTWGSSCRLTGCAYVHLRIKRTGNDRKAESPFAGGLSSRMTIYGKGMPVYDARYDSTRGGSGSLRADDPTTWAFTVSGNDIGKNPVCQLYSHWLGYTVGGVVSVGAGMPPERLDFDDMITAANIADESVTFSGGSAKRYETHGMFSDEEPAASVTQVLCTHMNAEPRDVSGKLGLRIAYDDLSGDILELDESDILGPLTWEPSSGVSETPTSVQGRYTSTSDAALFQMAPYPKCATTAIDGIERPLPLDLPMCQNSERAEHIATQVLERSRWQGRVTATFGPRALAATVGRPVKLSFGPRGWTDKLFRIERQEIKVVTSQEDVLTLCPMVLIEESAVIYDPPSTSAAAGDVSAPSYDALNNPLIITAGNQIGVDNGATRNLAERAINRNSSFEDFDVDSLPIGWRITRGAAAVSSTGLARRGTEVLLMQPNAVVESDPFPVTPGETLWIDYSYFTSTDRTSGFDARWYVGIQYYNSSSEAWATSGLAADYAVASNQPVAVSAGYQDGVAQITVPGSRHIARLTAFFEDGNAGSGAVGMVDVLGISRAEPGADVTVNQPIVQYLDPVTGRVERSRFMSTALLLGVANTVSAAATATDQGSSTGVTISIPAHVRKIANTSGAESVSYNAGSLTNRSYSQTYHIYADDPDMVGGAVTYQSTTNPDDLLVNGRYHVTTITTPASGGASTGGSGGGGSVRPLPPGENIP